MAQQITTRRRVGASLAGLAQAVIGLVLLIASVASFGLVTDDDFSFNWLIVPALIVLTTIGLTVARVAGHQNWLPIGLTTFAISAVVIYPASIFLDNIFLGFVAAVLAQLAPAVWPNRQIPTPSVI